MKLYAQSNSRKLTQSISSYLEDCPNLHIKKEQFADGEINVIFLESVRDHTIYIIAQIEMPYDNLMETLMMCDAAKRSGANKIVLIVPYLPHSRQERRDDKRSPITARLIADMFQNAGVDHIISMDIHTSAIEGFYKIPFDKLMPTEVFIPKMREIMTENTVFVSPDFGFMKKIEPYVDEFKCPLVVINKHRLQANQISKMELIGNVHDKDVIIVDDMIDTATTLVKAAELLKNEGAKSINVFATHGVLSHSGTTNAYYKLGMSPINKVYLTNTIPNIHESKNIEVLDISEILANAIIRSLYM